MTAKNNGNKSAFVMGRIAPAKEQEALARLRQLGQVDYAQLTAGKFDFIAKIRFGSFESFFDAYSEVKEIPNIRLQKILMAMNGSQPSAADDQRSAVSQ